MSIKEVQIKDWLHKCKHNIHEFKNNYEDYNEIDKKEFIKTQYRLVSIINNVLNGRTRLCGFDQSKFKRLKEEEE